MKQRGDGKYGYACFRAAEYLFTYQLDDQKALGYAEQGPQASSGDTYGLQIKRQILLRLGRKADAEIIAEDLSKRQAKIDLPGAMHLPHMSYPHK